jgi:hypothetical protein
MASASSSAKVTFTHAQDPNLKITCYSVGSYEEMAGRAAYPIMRCFLSSGRGADGGGSASGVPMGSYHSERGGLSITCEDAALDAKVCSIGRTQVTDELPGGVTFITDCNGAASEAFRCSGGEPVITRLEVSDARTADSAMLRDATGVPAGATAASADRALEQTMTCMRTLVTRPVPITIYSTGPTMLD